MFMESSEFIRAMVTLRQAQGDTPTTSGMRGALSELLGAVVTFLDLLAVFGERDQMSHHALWTIFFLKCRADR